jgi:hypothetical protein
MVPVRWCVALVVLALGCSRAPIVADGDRSAGGTSSASAPLTMTTRLARAPLSGQRRPEEQPPGPSELTETTRALASAKLRVLEAGPERAQEGIFQATLDGAGLPPSARAEVRVSLLDAPIAFRRRLAFHRLAGALGAHVVPACVERAMTLEAIGDLLAGQRPALDAVRERAAVRNDGTVVALWMALAPDGPGSPWSPPQGAPLDPYGGGEPARWSRWIEAPEREADEVPTLARDWLEMIALDYLAATSHRRSVFVVRDAEARGAAIDLVLFDNVNAFSPAPARTASSSLLKRLTLAQRFPRALRAGLIALTPARAAALFAPGGFETWLLPPRALVELEERRAALLSLIEAKIAGRDEAAVLTD